MSSSTRIPKAPTASVSTSSKDNVRSTSASINSTLKTLSDSEKNRFLECFGNDNFRNMFFDYMKEIQSPEAKAEYESYLEQIEKQQNTSSGGDVNSMTLPKNTKLIKPNPLFCVKLFRQTKNQSKQKLFINLCYSKLIECAFSTSATDGKGNKGEKWSVPHVLSPERKFIEDEDNTKDKQQKNADAVLYDFIIGEETYEKYLNPSSSNARVSSMIVDTAIEAIDRIRKTLGTADSLLKWQRLVLKNVKCKGGNPPFLTMNMKEQDKSEAKKTEISAVTALTAPTASNPQNNGNEKQNKGPSQTSPTSSTSPVSSPRPSTSSSPASSATSLTPQYTITERGSMDLQQFSVDLNGASSLTPPEDRRPQELVVKIELPGVSTAAHLELLMNDTSITLTETAASPAVSSQSRSPFSLAMTLPYRVRSNQAKAHFEKKAQRLTLTFPVCAESSEEKQKRLEKWNELRREKEDKERKEKEEQEEAERKEKEEEKQKEKAKLEEEQKKSSPQGSPKSKGKKGKSVEEIEAQRRADREKFIHEKEIREAAKENLKKEPKKGVLKRESTDYDTPRGDRSHSKTHVQFFDVPEKRKEEEEEERKEKQRIKDKEMEEKKEAELLKNSSKEEKEEEQESPRDDNEEDEEEERKEKSAQDVGSGPSEGEKKKKKKKKKNKKKKSTATASTSSAGLANPSAQEPVPAVTQTAKAQPVILDEKVYALKSLKNALTDVDTYAVLQKAKGGMSVRVALPPSASKYVA